MMEAATSFTSRRPAAGALPAFSLPPPNADVPSMAKYPLYPPLPGGIFQNSLDSASTGYSTYTTTPSYLPLPGSLPDTRRSPSPSVLTPSPGASDGLSPSLSSVNTGSSQGSQAPAGMQYSSYGHVHGSWPTPVSSSYTVSSATAPQHSLGQPFGRASIFNPTGGMQQPSHFRDPRTSQSPATGTDGLPAPPYGDVQQPFQTAISSGGAGSGAPHSSGLSSAPPPAQSAILSSQSTQPPTTSSASAHVDTYTHTRPASNSGYYATSSAPQQHSFPAYASQPSTSQHSPTTTGPISRGLSSISGPPGSAMAPPAPYRYPPYQPLSNMGGSILSNVHQPGAQMTMIPGMPPYSSHSIVYGHAPAPPQSERPFKCDQCVQSFSRNHDLKRHKRIHLAVKPFPCTFCSKSFSRKDALKRHRLVKGCEGKPTDVGNNDNNENRNPDREDSNEPMKREP